MIYLIGGPPRCGKSTLARALSKEMNVGLVSTDLMDDLLKPYITASKVPKLYPKDQMRLLTGGSNEVMYSKYSPLEIVNAYLVQAKVIHSGLEELFDHCLKYKTNIIVEGFHITPELVTAVFNRFGKEKFKVVFVVKVNTSDALSGFCANKAEEDWVKDKSENTEIYPKIAKMVSLFSKTIKKQASDRKLTVIDNQGDFVKQIENGKAYLMGRDMG